MSLAFAAALVSIHATPAKPVSDLSDLDRFIQAKLAEFQVPGAVVAVIEDGQIKMVKGYGFRDVAKKLPLDENTRFLMASVSKSFTAAAAGTMVDAGKLDWDRPIFNYLPEFTFPTDYPGRNINMRDLLAHRTGWPAFSGDFFDPLGYNRAEILYRLRYLQPTNSLREKANYSNPGYFVAGEVTAKVANQNWNAVVQKRLLDPLEMTNSGLLDADLKSPNAIKGYAVMNGKMGEIEVGSQATMAAAGGLISTGKDMANFVQMLANGGQFKGKTILKSETVDQLFTRTMVSPPTIAELPPISDTTGFAFTLGFGAFTYGGEKIIEKGGALAGVRTVINLIPNRKAGIVVLCNLNFTAFPESVRAYWLAKTLNQPWEADQKTIAGINAQMMKIFQTPEWPKNPAPFPGNVALLPGVYENETYGRMELVAKDGKMFMIGGPAKFTGTVQHWSGGVFALKWPIATVMYDDVTFELDDKNVPIHMTVEGLGVYKRVK
jgi:CubicO group peptidase (beta-lactamase class C family)